MFGGQLRLPLEPTFQKHFAPLGLGLLGHLYYRHCVPPGLVLEHRTAPVIKS